MLTIMIFDESTTRISGAVYLDYVLQRRFNYKPQQFTRYIEMVMNSGCDVSFDRL
jgi:hypothetical protein